MIIIHLLDLVQMKLTTIDNRLCSRTTVYEEVRCFAESRLIRRMVTMWRTWGGGGGKTIDGSKHN